MIDEARVSWRHAVLRLEGSTWLLEDVGSTNGTFLGAERVKRVEITKDCVLRLGHPDDGQRLWCSIAAPPRDATAVASPIRDEEPPTNFIAPPPSAAPPSRPAAAPSPPAAAQPFQAYQPPAQPQPPSTSRRPSSISHRPSRSRPAVSAPAQPSAAAHRRAPAAAQAYPEAGARSLPARAAGRIKHRPPAQRDHAAADPGAADRPGQRQRDRRLRPQRLPLPRRAAPVEPRRVRDRRPGQPQRHVRQRPAGHLGPGDRGGHHRHRAGHVPSGRPGAAGVHRHRRRLAERAGPDRQDLRREGAARPRELPARRALPARRDRPERRGQVDAARRADRDAARGRGLGALRRPRPLQELRGAEAPDRAGAAGRTSCTPS